jgi:hypothetical protein
VVGGTRKVTPKMTKNKLPHGAELPSPAGGSRAHRTPGLREALLAPAAAPALPDAARSSSTIVP